MKKLFIVLILLAMQVNAGEALNASKNFWSKVSGSTSGTVNPLVRLGILGFVVIGQATSNLIASEIDANKEQNASVNIDNNMTEANTTKDQ